MIIDFLPFQWQVILSFIAAFAICYMMIPPIIRLARDKKFVALPDERTSHEFPIPTIGGIAIYLAFILSSLLFGGITNAPILPYITASTLIIFIVGLKDDVYQTSPKVKLLGEFAAILVAVILADIRITNFQGVFGIYEVSYSVSVGFSILVFVGVTNAINLMDGIDGLAASLGIVACIGFGIFFWTTKRYGEAISCASLIGALAAFLRFNYASSEKKIFMGDTGSLIIGFIIACLAIRFNEINIHVPLKLKVHASPVISVAILAIPIFDTLRVMIFRIIKKKSPFKPDKSHIHHVLLTKGYSHHNATILISTFSFLLIVFMYSIQYKVTGNTLLFILIAIVAIFYVLPFTFYFNQIKSLFRRKENLNK